MKKRNLYPILFAFFAFLLLFHLLLFWHAKDDALNGSADFSIFYTAAKMVQHGEGAKLYDVAEQGRMESVLYPKVATPGETLIYDHPPLEALLFLPLAYVSYSTAYLIWLAVSILLLLLAVRLLSPFLKEIKALWAPLAVLIFLGFFPIFVCLLQGQDSILLLLLITLVFINLKKGRDFKGGILLAIALFKFQYTVPFLVPFILWRRWEFLSGVAVSSAGLFLLSLPVAGFWGTLSYATFLINLMKGISAHRALYSLGFPPNTVPNIWGAVEMMAHNVLSRSFRKGIIIVLSGLAVLWLAKCWPLGRRTSAKAFDLGFSLAVVTSVLVSYHVLLHDLSLLLIPFVLVLNQILRNEICTGRRRAVAFGIITLFYLSPLYLLLMGHGRMYLFFWPILAFFVLLSWELVDLAKGREPAGGENLPGPVADAT